MFRKLVFILVLASLTAGCGQSRPVEQGASGSRGTTTPFSGPAPQSTVTTSPAPLPTVESPAAVATSQLRPDDATAFLNSAFQTSSKLRPISTLRLLIATYARAKALHRLIRTECTTKLYVRTSDAIRAEAITEGLSLDEIERILI